MCRFFLSETVKYCNISLHFTVFYRKIYCNLLQCRCVHRFDDLLIMLSTVDVSIDDLLIMLTTVHSCVRQTFVRRMRIINI